jgi:transmembrane sensor
MNASAHHPIDDVIEAQAAAWLAQREEGFTPDQEADFLRWQLADSRHRAAVDRLEQTCELLSKLPRLRGDPRLDGTEEKPASKPHQPVRWVRWTSAAAAIAACVAIAAVYSFRPASPEPQLFATTPSSYQRVLLPDSSIAQLNGSTSMQVRFTADERRVNLTVGEAHFNVAKDTTRPFVVEANGLQVRAVGTAFNVRLLEDGVDVLVTEGVVRIEDPKSPGAHAVVVAAGERSRVTPAMASAGAAQVARVEPRAIQSALSWQTPSFVFVEEPLATVVQRFNAANRVQLVLGDDIVGGLVIGGTFRADDVDTFVRLLESADEISVERQSSGRWILRKR